MKAAGRPTIVDLLAHPERAAELQQVERDRLLRQLGALVLLLTTTESTTTTEHTNGTSRLLTVEQAAEIANVSVQWIWRKSRRVDARPWASRLGRRTLRVAEREFHAWLAGATR